MNRELDRADGATPRLLFGFLFGFLLLASVPSLLWPWCREWFGALRAEDSATMFARKVEASALASLCGALAVATAAFAVRPGLPLRPFAGARAALAYGAWLPLWGLFVWLYLTVLHAFGQVVDAQEPLRYLVQQAASRPAWWLVLLAASVGAPVAEELLFRGFLQPLLQPRLGRTAGLAATSLLFGLGHGLAYALPVGLLGAFFGWLTQRHGSLLPAMFAHALHNTVTIAAMVAWPPLFDLMYSR